MRLGAGCMLVATLSAGVARAEAPPPPHCAGPQLVLEPPLSNRRSWSEAAGEARRRVAELTDVDTCTRLEVEQTARAIQVRARAGDGRSVVRDLSGPDELEPTVVALLVLPPSTEVGGVESEARATKPRAAEAAAPPAPSAKPPQRAPDGNPAADRGAAPASKLASGAEPASSLELGLGASARAAGYLRGPGATAVVNGQLQRWLFGAVVHGEQVSTTPGANRFSVERSASLGALFGRRLTSSPLYLDVALVAPVLVVRTSEWVQTTATSTPGELGSEPGENEQDSDDPVSAPTTTTVSKTKVVAPYADLRAGAMLRAVWPFSGKLGAVAALDFEHTLGVLPTPETSGQPVPVAFSVGLTLGIFWSSL